MDGVIALVIHYKYLILFPLAALEGPVVALVAGLLTSLGYLEMLPAFGIILLGDFLPDVGYFLVGRHIHNRKFLERFDKHLAFLSRHLPMLRTLWHEHGRKTMFISKLAYGFSTPLLMSAGLTNLPLKRYIAYALPVSVFKCAVIMALGYLLVESYMHALKYIQGAGLMFAGLVLVIIAGYVFVAVRARRTILALEEEAQCE